MHFRIKSILKNKHNYQIFYTCFFIYINFNYNFYKNTYVNTTNHIFLKFNFLKIITIKTILKINTLVVCAGASNWLIN